MAAIFFLVAGVLLAAAEMLTGDFTLLMLGGGAIITAGIGFGAGTSLVIDAVIFGVVSLLLLFVVRPVLLRRFATPPPTPTNTDALPGKTALVLAPISEHNPGRIKLGGEVWSARPFDPTVEYPEGETVYVMRIDGATAVVWKGP
ncbi:NfeD family protein [Nocardia panacis]|uniref:NfeD family protein n=1 Tax=Nocardia panacis TaxID=2340916 RepID=A0A3A4K6H0_9NOCA|nr:NfeD family protein [Nocardia panacis]RJO68249.1 NfeD family protein [Nocardia panacis]